MCGTCGCGSEESIRPADRDHHRSGRGSAAARGGEAPPRAVRLEADLLDKNGRIAHESRTRLARLGAVAVNVMGGPGAGKTALLEATIRALSGSGSVAVIEGDQATERDGDRIRAAGAPVVQVNTGAGCHLDADMVTRALDELDPAAGSLILVENVGNLVCPALFDLGERAKAVVMSTTEGEDKPVKYPHMFREADVFVVNKIDLLPHLAFDLDQCLSYAHQVNPRLRVVSVSATRGDGISAWIEWLRAEVDAAAASQLDGANHAAQPGRKR